MFVMLALFFSSAHAVEILYAEPVLNCSKPYSLFNPNPQATNGIVNLFLGERTFMQLNPTGPNYNLLLPVTGSGMFNVSDIYDGTGLLETACSFPYGVSVGQSYYGGILRYTLLEIEQMYSFPQGSFRVESTDYDDLDGDGVWDPGEPVITVPAFATFDLNIGTYTTPVVTGPMVDFLITQIPQVGNNITVTAIATPPSGRGIQGIYLQEMPNGIITSLPSLFPPITTS